MAIIRIFSGGSSTFITLALGRVAIVPVITWWATYLIMLEVRCDLSSRFVSRWEPIVSWNGSTGRETQNIGRLTMADETLFSSDLIESEIAHYNDCSAVYIH